MKKTIEELASAYYLNEVINGDTCDDKDGWTDCFVSGAEAFMQLPLIDSLTAEEKESMIIAHKAAKQFYDAVPSSANEVFKGQVMLLESIFGKEMFNEKEK